ncbi:sigma 54-interacting transcriptional regulator [Vallitalea maricola]|uniref:Uncharacterized protein n=1 Tax=Vallitalea maricola TaxID=3074433 RepID=A0ACB5URV0_9FIRM|nr:hypothetical protein AN2V17_41880 [Vallitalea sp. AN17-2]
MKINRLIQIIMILLNKKMVTVKYLADKFEVSTRTIYRDLETLSLSGIPICSSKGNKGGISLLEGYSLKYAFLPGPDKKRMIFDIDALVDIEEQIVHTENFIEDYSKAWQCFIENRTFNQKAIKEEILQSWKRCKINEVSLYDFDIDMLMKPEEKLNYVVDELVEYNVNGFKEFSQIVKNLDLDICIYDCNAKLKYIFNISPLYDKMYPEVGYFKDVSELVIGTNSTCLALAENRPCMVVGPEHYKHIFHEFSCVAAPIYSQTQLIGTVNASFVHTSVNHETLNMVYSLARLYEKLVINSTDNTPDHPMRTTYRYSDFPAFEDIKGISSTIQRVKKLAKKTAATDLPVFIYGEKGTGKKLLAQAIHNESPRKYNPFITFNCRSIPQELIDIELFGYNNVMLHGKSNKSKVGLLEKASSGTIYIEGIELMPMNTQVKLLESLESMEVKPIGGNDPLPIDVRLITSAQSHLTNELHNKSFLQDLYYEITLIQFYLPPLRERKEDITTIITNYIPKFSKNANIPIKHYDCNLLDKLIAYDYYYGNIHELLNVLERLVILSSGETYDISLVPF